MVVKGIRPIDGGVRVDILVVPNASRTEIVGMHGDRVRVRLSSPPDKGKANKELASLLTAATGASSAIVVFGSTSRRKTVDLSDVGTAAVESALVAGK